MSRLDDWLDEECGLVESRLTWDELPDSVVHERVADCREKLSQSYHGRVLALKDAWAEFKDAFLRTWGLR